MRRNRTFLGPQGMGGMVSMWGGSSLIQSVQQGTMTMDLSVTGTTTITAVNTANSLLIYDWSSSSSGANTSFMMYLTLTNATTVTATTVGTSNSRNLRFTVVEFVPGVIRSVQQGTITLASVTNATATITSVNTAKSCVFWMGLNTNVSDDRAWANLQLQNATTVNAGRANGSTGDTLVAYQVLEFF